MQRFHVMLTMVMLSTAIVARAGDGLPVIDHAPVKVSVAGQGVAIRARIMGPVPKSVFLFVAASRDATPFKIPMENSGAEVYAATIPQMHLAGLSEVYYYIEARTLEDTPVETSWYTIMIRSAQSGAEAGGLTSDGGGNTVESERRWLKPVLIGGGLLAAGGIALAASSGGGGGGDGGGEPPPVDSSAGTYVGTDTTCERNPLGTTTCESSGVTIKITDQGVVQCADLRDGQTLEQTLAGDSFVLVGTVDENGLTGEIQYIGTVIDRRIVGSIQGSATSVGGVTTFSGTFSAVR